MNPSDLPDETLFEGALKCRTPAERAAYLDQVCANQPELRRKMEALLAAHDRAGEFMEPAADARPTVKLDLAPEESPGSVIGRYKLLQRIGEGGMGTVYMAEQTEPVIRKVALKIIKLGMDTRQVVARFEAERQALALMDHPNIARVLDAGATDTGRPYFVMELVHGVPITEYCDKNKLSAKARLELFIPVCQAIQHAHQKGIIHRDIKPSNVMVTLHDGRPVPRVIDFGIAKATNQRLTEKTLFTNYSQMIGTPAYMSPEQAEMSGLDIDTRSDVYSLGVLLYELLTGTTPFSAKELLSKGYVEMQRIIAEQEPPKPSTRMSTMQKEERTVVATNRSMNASALHKVLQGDLDWIVMKCLEKDRTRRYETSNALAADVQRHLSNELIAARAPTAGYMLAKLIRRNKLLFGAASAVVAALAIGLSLATWQAVKARKAQIRAQNEAATSSQIATFLTEMLGGVKPSVAAGRDTALLREILERTEQRLDKELGDQPATKAVVLRILARTYRELELFEKAETLGRESLRLSLATVGENHVNTLNAMKQLSGALWERNQFREAQALQRRMIRIAEKLFGPESRETAEAISYYAFSSGNLGEWKEEEANSERAIALCRKCGDKGGLLVALGNHAGVLFRRGDMPAAEEAQREALALSRKIHGDLDPQTLGLLGNMAKVQRARGDLAGAAAAQRELIEKGPRIFGENSRGMANALQGLADILSDQGKVDEAETTYRKAVAMQRVVYGSNNPQVAATLRRLATVLLRRKRARDATEADRLLQEAHQIWQRAEARRDPNYVDFLDTYGTFLTSRRQFSRAEPLLNEAFNLHTNLNLSGPRHLEISRLQLRLGICRIYQGDTDGGRRLLEQAKATLTAIPNPWTDKPRQTEQVAIEIAENLRASGAFADSEQLLKRVLQSRTQRLPANHSDVAGGMAILGGCLADWAWHDQENPDKALVGQRAAEAERITRESLNQLEGVTKPTTNFFEGVKIHLGSALTALATVSPTLSVEEKRAKYREAETFLLTGREHVVETDLAFYSLNRGALEWLVRLYNAWEKAEPGAGKAASAAKWKAELEAFDRRLTAGGDGMVPAGAGEQEKSSPP